MIIRHIHVHCVKVHLYTCTVQSTLRGNTRSRGPRPAWRKLVARFVNAAHAREGVRAAVTAVRLLLSAPALGERWTALPFFSGGIHVAGTLPAPRRVISRQKKKGVVCLLLLFLASSDAMRFAAPAVAFRLGPPAVEFCENDNEACHLRNLV